jgi:hypothetical protein
MTLKDFNTVLAETRLDKKQITAQPGRSQQS